MLIGKHSTSAEIHSLKVSAPSHCDVPMNRATIAISGVIPFTKLLLEHPEIRKGGACRKIEKRRPMSRWLLHLDEVT